MGENKEILVKTINLLTDRGSTDVKGEQVCE